MMFFKPFIVQTRRRFWGRWPLPSRSTPSLRAGRVGVWHAACDKIAVMGKREKAERVSQSERQNVLRLRLNSHEMDELVARAKSAGFGRVKSGETEIRDENVQRAAYVRSILLAAPTAPLPDFPSLGVLPPRTVRLRIRLSFREDQVLNALADAAGVETERYARWRLFGVTE